MYGKYPCCMSRTKLRSSCFCASQRNQFGGRAFMMTRGTIGHGDQLNGAVKLPVNRCQTARVKFGVIGMSSEDQQTWFIVHNHTNFVMPGRAISTSGASPQA